MINISIKIKFVCCSFVEHLNKLCSTQQHFLKHTTLHCAVVSYKAANVHKNTYHIYVFVWRL